VGQGLAAPRGHADGRPAAHAAETAQEIGQLPDTVRKLRTEEQVRDAVADVNDQVRAWWRSSVGPQIHVGLVDIESIVQQWRSEQPAPEPPPADQPPPKKRWWRRG
jgi:hypothetical protein